MRRIDNYSTFDIITAKTEKRYIEEIQEAAFRSGKAGLMIQKIGNVLSRKTKLKVGISSVPMEYKNKYGKFNGYFGYYGSDGALRFNFRVGNRDEVYSIDFYDNSNALYPDYTVDLLGYNIVQLLDIIADIMTGDYFDYIQESSILVGKKGTRLSERLKISTMMAKYFTDNPQILSDVESGRIDYDRLADSFMDYIAVEFNSKKQKFNVGAIQTYIRQALLEMGKKTDAQKVPGVEIKGGAEEFFATDPEMLSLWSEAIHPDPVQVMEDLEDTIANIGRGNKFISGALIFGKSGSGKTETVMSILKEVGAKFETFKLPIGGYTGFLYILYQHRDDEILFFDDNDSMFADEACVNILKHALESKPVRTFVVPKDIKVRGADEVVPQGSFDFTSKIIFCSNLTKTNLAIDSRLAGSVYEINFTNDEMLALIKHNISSLYAEYPEITDKDKDEVFDFIKKIIPVSKDIDYRKFNAVLVAKDAANKVGDTKRWKVKAIKVLNTMPDSK